MRSSRGDRTNRRRRAPGRLPILAWMAALWLTGSAVALDASLAGDRSAPLRVPLTGVVEPDQDDPPATVPVTGPIVPIDGSPLIADRLPEMMARVGDRPLPNWGPRVEGMAEPFFTIDLATYEFITILASLRAESATTVVYVEDAQWGTRVGQSQVDAILAAFDLQTPEVSIAPDVGIGVVVESVYGPATDIDGDGKVHILILDIRDTFSGSGAFVAGYYTSHDQTTSYGSNHRDLLYIDCDPADVAGDDVLGTVAHEFQHLVHFRADPDEGSSSPFMNESLSELSTYLCGYGLRSPGAFAALPDVALDAWENREEDYARVALWGLYLYEQLGLPGVQRIFADLGNGVTGIEGALAALASPRDFSTLLADWFVANAINAHELDERYGYQAWGGTVSPVATHTTYPAGGSGAVEHRAADVVRLRGEEMTVVLDATGGVGLRGRAVATTAGGSALQVDELGLSETWSALAAQVDADEVLLVVFSTGVFSADYAYTAGATPGNIVELAYDDGTAEFLGVLRREPVDRGLAVRFTSPEAGGTVRTLRLFNGDPTPYDVYLWDAGGPEGAPGATLLGPVPVTPLPGIGWIDVDLRSQAVTVPAGDFYAGLLLSAGTDTTMLVSVGLDEDPPAAERSWLYDSGAWNPFTAIGFETADLMMRVELEYPDVLAPEFAIGVLHQPVLTANLAIYVIGEEPLNAQSLSGTFEHGGQSETLGFSPVDGGGEVFVADGVTLTSAGTARVVINATGLRGVTAGSDTLTFQAEWLGRAGGLLAWAGGELELSAGALAHDQLCTAQPGGSYPGGPTLVAGERPARVTLGPATVALLAPATVRLTATGGRIARWDGGAWRPLATTRNRSGALEATTLALGSFTVLSGDAAPAICRILPLGANPVGIESTFGLELVDPAERVHVAVFNASGRVVLQLRDGPLAAGSHVIPLDLRGQAAGVYWLQAVADGHRAQWKVVYVR